MTTEPNVFEKFPALQGIAFALLVALSTELTLQHFTSQHDLLAAGGRVAIIFLSLFIIHRFSLVSLVAYSPSLKDLITLIVLLFGSVLMVGFGRIVVLGLVSYPATGQFLGKFDPASFYYAVPYAAAGLILKSVLGLHFGLVFGLSLALIIGTYFPSQPVFVLYILITNLVACLSLARFRSRSAYVRAGLNIALVSLPFVFGAVMMNPTSAGSDLVVGVIAAFIGGALCIFVASGITPIVEYLGSYVTDLRLIEMATLDHPLLKELSIQAPGTWNHSMVMGMMAEAAADAVGANPVVARVGAYFHDIGKTKKPLYFVENQAGGENRHDKLSPSMSALIIRAHVKDGIELARKHALPAVIEHMIPQHHGTSIIEYFYDKACKEAENSNPEGAEVDRSLYTYPGPKPQTKEAGILMLADGVEAAARTLGEPSLDRLQGLVQKMINKVFASGELDECELTLKDLHLIAKCFTRVLNGIYHQRIAYAEPAEKTQEEETDSSEGAEELGSSGSNKRSKPETQERQGKEDSKEDLKRLGLQ